MNDILAIPDGIDAELGTGDATVLVVDDPQIVAERCWDAGLTVLLRDGAEGSDSLFVVDLFGRLIALVPRESGTSVSRFTYEEKR